MKKGILELIKKIYGSNALSKVLGTRTNVIRLPDNELKQYTNKELNIEAASDKLVQKAKADINELLAEYPQMNDAEKLIFEGNLTRLGNTLGVIEKKQGPAADVIKFGTSEKVSPEGVMSLTKKTQVTDLKTEATKRKSVDDLIDEYNANQDRLRLSDEEGGTLIGYEEYEQLRKRNKDISKALENKGISSKVEKKPEAEIIPFTNKPDPEDFATGGRVGMAGGGILKLAMKFFNDNNPVSAYKKYLKYVKETAQKDPAKLAPEVGGIVVGSELIHRGLRRKLKEVKEKNNENDSENLETDNRTEKAGGGVSQGLDYLAGIERRGYAGGSILKTIGKKLIKKPKTETTSIDPIIDENVDLSKRGFLKGAAGVGAGIAAFGSGALKLAKKGAKEVKDLDVVFRKNYDGEYVDGTPTVFSEIIADIVPYTKKAKTFLEDMVKQKKVIKNNDGSYFVDVQDIHDMGGDIGVFKDIGNKFNYKTFKTDNYVDIEEIKDLRSYSSPLKNNPTYGPIDFEDDAAEYVADVLQPKTAKEIIKERTDLIERKLKERGDFAGGGPIKKIAQKLIKKPKKYKFTGEESLNDLYELERQGKITREDMNVYSPRYLEYLDAQIINKEKLYTPKEWEKTPEVLKNKMRGRIDPDWEEANFGEEFNWDQARSIEMKQQKQLQDFDITGRKKNAKGGLNYLMGL
jgi:hypothetical protein